MNPSVNASINEAAALARKATKGAGYDWSMADEAAFATAWLCRQGLDGATILAQHLSYAHERDIATLRLRSLHQPWRASESGLCALSAGATLSDLAHDTDTRQGELEQLITPALLLPFIAYAMERLHRGGSGSMMRMGRAALRYTGFEAELRSYSGATWLHRCSLAQGASSMKASQPPICADVRYRIEAQMSEQADASATPHVAPISRTHRTHITADAWATLNQFAALTYAPATDASRRGAGAGTTDND